MHSIYVKFTTVSGVCGEREGVLNLLVDLSLEAVFLGHERQHN
jgi:hypothetical protein